MFQVFNNSLDDFRKTYPKHITFALIYMVLTSVLFMPIISVIFNRLLMLIGAPTVINHDVYSIALSYSGAIALTVVGLMVFALIFIEFGVFIVLAQQHFFNQSITLANAFLTAVSKTPKLISVSILPLIMVLFLLVPFVETPIDRVVYDLNMDILYSGHLSLSYLSIAVYFGLLVLVLYIILRWIFAIHYIVIEGLNVRKAIRQSMRLTKGNKKSVLVNIIAINLLIFALSTLLIYLISLIPSGMVGTIIGDLIEHYLVTISTVIAALSTLVLVPINMIILTRLFYQFKQDYDEVKDELKVVKSKKLAKTERKAFKFFKSKRYLVVLLLIVYVTGVFAYNQTVSGNLVYLDWSVEVASHRGDSVNAPENSMSGVQSAIEKGINVIEIDIQLTEDGVAVLHHDMSLMRMAGEPERISELTYEELSELEIGSSYSEEFAGEPIPKLEDVIEVAQEAGVRLLLDLKPDDNETELAQEIVRLIEEYEAENDIYAMAFNNQVLREIRALNEDIEIGQILFTAVGDLSRLDVDFYTVHQTMLSESLVEEARQDGRGVWVWSTNIDRTANQILQYDVDGIITKTPDVVLRMFELRE
ncbi:glycerophosphoryl diester phosphodiesterase membrane domain-containing protein [Alkalibacillus haloalkaliphilus]|uniref:glycerophosphoryl diester phosphodiesterase membrane domain-containing protein n=1 Tax=Alkalibacillus haloalkaliphilus TaxID=94136 RepID=UPI0029354EB5|nr:glycerophosphodiester phosphodiesterase family protein [Alkalibacillus haloalkaliphilus]MDV2582977.1 glycerophosphoryl diester phosphodiesterase membrane domain-containing protein [Alkalibacillus haloalkaliphilus]